MHDFQEKLDAGELAAREVAKHLERKAGWKLYGATKSMQRRGIDFYGKNSKGYRYTLEVKADWKAYETRNLFIETKSNVEKDVDGWALTSWAQLIALYVPTWELAYLLPMTTIRIHLGAWVSDYEEKECETTGKHETYHSRGVCVPWRIINDISTQLVVKSNELAPHVVLDSAEVLKMAKERLGA